MRWIVAALLILALAGCSTGGDTLPPPDWSGGPHDPVVNPPDDVPHDGSGEPDGGGTPTDPVLEIGVIDGHPIGIAYYFQDAARIPSWSVLDSLGNAVRTIALDKPWHFDRLPLGTYTVGLTYFDAAWGTRPEVIWQTPPVTLSLQGYGVSGLEGRMPEDHLGMALQHYHLFPVNIGDAGNHDAAFGYRDLDDPHHRVWINIISLGMLKLYPNDGSAFDYNNNGDPLEGIYLPLGKTVKFGWYKLPDDYTGNALNWRTDTLTPIVEYGPFEVQADNPTVDLTMDFSNLGEAIPTH